jgi:hypothetical protein
MRIRIKRRNELIIFLYHPDRLCDSRGMIFGPGRGSETHSGFCDDLPANAVRSARLREVHAYWRELGHSLGHLPGRQHLDPLALKPHLPFLWMVDAVPVAQGMRYRYRLIGTEIVAARGGDDTGKFVDEVNRELAGRQEVSARFALVLQNGQAHWRLGPPLWVNIIGDRAPYIENIYMPLAATDGTAGIVLVVNAYLDHSLREIALYGSRQRLP